MRRSLLLLAALLGGCGSDDAEESGGSAAAVEIVASDFAFDPDSVTVDEAGKTTFRLVNEGGTAHALEIEGGDVEEETDAIEPGESAELTVQLDAGEYELYCPIANHRELGMEGTIVVGGGATTAQETDEGYG